MSIHVLIEIFASVLCLLTVSTTLPATGISTLRDDHDFKYYAAGFVIAEHKLDDYIWVVCPT